ncbi:glycosyltransferase family 4 protein [Candidatus Woesearchaeota archaeon]|nr:glycosyltransferase family 4 protein [Candidatus Woesearchaeota archaeon]MCF7900766.1 glycosyltransferase family 4 protein [Candidatus Woesearchaeota archaeon]MCF8012931.1 glycosyltransferase family 4 protein [Candidatus Woesearchaeota archaeon]
MELEKKINILHIIDSMGLGGAQRVLQGIMKIKQQNIKMISVALRKSKKMMNHKQIHILNSHSKYSTHSLFVLKKIIKKNKIDILHCHLFRSQINGFILKTFFYPKIQLIFHEHGQINGSDKNNTIENILFKTFISISKNKVNKYVAVSNYIKNKLIKENIQHNKIHTLDNFYIKSKNFKINKLVHKRNTIGYIGRLSKIKRVELLIKSIKNTENKLLIAGEGPETINLKRLTKKLKLENQVKFLGYTENIDEFYNKCNIIVIPSKSEASPIVLFEAWSRGIPVIVSNIKQLSEYCIDNKNVLLFNNSKDLCQKITHLMTNNDIYLKLSTFGIKESKKYDLKNYAKKLIEVYTNEKN